MASFGRFGRLSRRIQSAAEKQRKEAEEDDIKAPSLATLPGFEDFKSQPNWNVEIGKPKSRRGSEPMGIVVEPDEDDDFLLSISPSGLPKGMKKSLFTYGFANKQGNRHAILRMEKKAKPNEQYLEVLPEKTAESAWANLDATDALPVPEPEVEEYENYVPIMRNIETEISGPFPEDWNERATPPAPLEHLVERLEPLIPSEEDTKDEVIMERPEEPVSEVPVMEEEPVIMERQESVSEVPVMEEESVIIPTEPETVSEPSANEASINDHEPGVSEVTELLLPVPPPVKSPSLPLTEEKPASPKSKPEPRPSAPVPKSRVRIPKKKAPLPSPSIPSPSSPPKRKPKPRSKPKPKQKVIVKQPTTYVVSRSSGDTSASKKHHHPKTKYVEYQSVQAPELRGNPRTQPAVPGQNAQQMGSNNIDMCNFGVIPARTAAFKAPFVPLCETTKPVTLDADGNIIDCQEDGVKFKFRPRPNFATEISFTVEPQRRPKWQTMLNCGFTPLIYCNVPPCCLPGDCSQATQPQYPNCGYVQQSTFAPQSFPSSSPAGYGESETSESETETNDESSDSSEED